jgi:hypothetical protein
MIGGQTQTVIPYPKISDEDWQKWKAFLPVKSALLNYRAILYKRRPSGRRLNPDYIHQGLLVWKESKAQNHSAKANAGATRQHKRVTGGVTFCQLTVYWLLKLSEGHCCNVLKKIERVLRACVRLRNGNCAERIFMFRRTASTTSSRLYRSVVPIF